MSALDVVAPLLLGALQLGIAEGALPNKFLIFILREIHIKYLTMARSPQVVVEVAQHGGSEGGESGGASQGDRCCD